jgi:hypothetical protein
MCRYYFPVLTCISFKASKIAYFSAKISFTYCWASFERNITANSADFSDSAYVQMQGGRASQ